MDICKRCAAINVWNISPAPLLKVNKVRKKDSTLASSLSTKAPVECLWT